MTFNSDSSKWHLSCNLIKGYIDSREEIYKYLEFANKIGIRDVGFVGLMPENRYCTDKFVNFDLLNVESDRFIKTADWKRENICHCSNYKYLTEDHHVIDVYHRHASCGSYESSGFNFTFDGKYFRQGFTGEIIY